MQLPIHFRPTVAAAAIACLFCQLPHAAAHTPQNSAADKAVDNSTVLEEIIVNAPTPDDRAQAEVFHKNVSNVYVGKEYLERFKVNAAGDVLKGLNGVYNMNTRTAGGAISPNIRGITGKGRIPVTLDGTEQTIDVWMNNYGVGDRNYLDPALFRSIMVEKSPALTRGVKSGVGGAVSIRTIEAGDIVREGKKWGVQISGDVSNNALRPKNDMNRWLGWADYRTLPIGATADGAGGGADPITGNLSPAGLVIDDMTPPKHHESSDNYRFNQDRSLFAAAAFKTDIADGLAAYSHRKKGNYFAGKHGAGGYLNNPVHDLNKCYDEGKTHADCLHSSTFVPNMAKVYHPGVEVLNSNTDTKTLLLKNNWYLPNHHKLSWQYMTTGIRFGEINPFHSTYVLNMEEHNEINRPQELSPQVQSIDSQIRTDTYKLGWEWKPKDHPLINLEANLWRIKTNSTRHQSGGMSLSSARPDQSYDIWHWCTQRGKMPPDQTDFAANCDELMDQWGIKGKTKEEVLQDTPNEDGKFAVLSGAEQKTRVSRTGFDISNRFRLNNRLNLTLSADYQDEKLEEEVEIVNSNDLFNLVGMTTGMSKLAGPRGGERREWGANMVFDWKPTDRLKISAGVRYHNFRGYDSALAEGRRRRDPRYMAGGEGSESYRAGVYMPYWELTSAEEERDIRAVENAWEKAWDLLSTSRGTSAAESAWITAENLEQQHRERYNHNRFLDGPLKGRFHDNTLARINQQGELMYSVGMRASGDSVYSFPLYRIHSVFIPFVNGKVDSNLIYQHFPVGMFDETVDNPQQHTGRYYRYLANTQNSIPGREPCSTPTCAHEHILGGGLSNAREGTSDIGGVRFWGNAGDTIVYKNYTEAQRWADPKVLRAHAWAPTIAVSYDLTDNSRLFARYAQMTRFPSVYEIGSFYNDINHISTPFAPNFRFKPERSRSFEIGYSWNFAPYWRTLRHGDMRLTYYHNRIENVIETTDYFRTTQYDRKNTAGLEWQSRIDTGRFFASLGATYRLKQEMCDRDTTANFNPYRTLGLPECIEGGYGSTRGYQALQPQYSVNLDLGTRLMEEKLELGLRGVYHSRVNTKQYDKLLQQGWSAVFNTTGKPYHWRSSLVWDAYGRYQAHENLSLNFSITNLTNRYYLDPMSNVPAPGPGRTVTLGITAKF